MKQLIIIKNEYFTFIDLTDTQAKSEDEAILSAETIEKALETVPDAEFMIHNGDLVDDGVKEEQWDWLLGNSQESLLNTTILPRKFLCVPQEFLHSPKVLCVPPGISAFPRKFSAFPEISAFPQKSSAFPHGTG